jgi:hypothetical protein
LKLFHLYTGSDGRSHFRDIELATVTDAGGVAWELRDHVEGMSIRVLVPGWSPGFHTAPRRQLVLQLTGVGELECGDGEVRRLGPGDLLLADDTTGEGHLSREVQGPRRQLLIYLDPTLDVDSLVRGCAS